MSSEPQAVTENGIRRADEPAAPGSPGNSAWHAVDATLVAKELDVELERGLSAEEARSRLQSHGPNRLAGQKKESGLQALLRQYRDFMQIILVAAAAISLIVTQDVGTGIASSLVIVEEVVKMFIRRRAERTATGQSAEPELART